MSVPAKNKLYSSNAQETLRAALGSGTLQQIKDMLRAMHPAETARLLESVPRQERLLIWGLVESEDEGEILLYLNDDVRSGLIETMDADQLIAVTGNLEFDDLVDFTADLPQALTQQLLLSMDQQNRELLEKALSYPEDSAGGLMNTDTVTIRPDVPVDVVLRYLRMKGTLPGSTDQLMVINRYGRFVGMISLMTLVTSELQSLIVEIMETDIITFDTYTPVQEVAKAFQDHDLLSAPVINVQGILQGRITIDDVVDVIHDEGQQRLLSMAGLDEDDDMFAPVISSARSRAIWLGTNLFTAFLAASVVGIFQDTIDQVVALAVLMPIVASMGGIGGSQTLTLMIRGLALDQIGPTNLRRLLRKEIMVALINGISWATMVGLVASMWFDNSALGVVIAAALILNMACAAGAGVGIPILLKRLNIDPALAGGVILTTITDILGFLTFLGLGTIYLI